LNEKKKKKPPQKKNSKNNIGWLFNIVSMKYCENKKKRKLKITLSSHSVLYGLLMVE
jgi:hypothetical protein